uniref:Phosphatidylcholine transfer protein n=1 Tax=Panstrongylus lignarius TaxID=156445 RepID=A0A224XNL8_9HEMI
MIVPFIAVSRYLIQNNCRSVHLQRNFNLPLFVRYKTQMIIDCKQLHSFKNVLPFGNLFDQMLQKTLPNFKRCSLLLILAKELKQAPRFIKDNSVCVFKSCIAQVEYVLAYRIRRGQQIFSLYTKLWDEMALKHFFQQIRRLAYRRGKEFLLGGATIAFDWRSEIISEVDIKSHMNELEICRFLRDKINQEKTCYCVKEASQENTGDLEDCCWSPFIKQEDLIVWKKEEAKHKGLYCYKMYGKYIDVTARDFLAVFLDIDNRTKWDQHVVQLKVIDSEPSTNSDIIYWETKWPKLFSNRDYVFTRRYLIDESEKVMIVMNRSTKHPDYPVIQSKSRVTEYWSYMVIKPTSEFNQPGIEFSLTYFDNPGISVPSAISLWVSSTGMPEYIKRLRVEALKISEDHKRREEIAATKAAMAAAEAAAKEKEASAESEQKEKVKDKEKEPPPTSGGGDDEQSSTLPQHQTTSPQKERPFEPFLIWASFLEKLGAKA